MQSTKSSTWMATPPRVVPLGSLSVAIDANSNAAGSLVRPSRRCRRNLVLTLNVISSSQPDPADIFTFDVDWENDGTYDERFTGTAARKSVTLYAAADTYVVGVRVIDKNLQSWTATYSIRITGYWRTEVGPAFPFARTGGGCCNKNGTIYVLGGQPYSPDERDGRARRRICHPAEMRGIQGAYLASNISGQGLRSRRALDPHIVFGGFELGHGQAGDAYVYDVNPGKIEWRRPRTGSPWGFAHTTDDQGFIYAAGGESLSIYRTAATPTRQDSNVTTRRPIPGSNSPPCRLLEHMRPRSTMAPGAV